MRAMIIGVLLCVTGSAHAAALGGKPTGDRARVERCSRLFGDLRAHQDNARARARRLDWVDEEQSGVTIAHAAEEWEEPINLELGGLKLVGTRGRAALFQITTALAASTGCPAGIYPVSVDARLTARTHVLAVLRRGVLVDHRGRLGFIKAPRAGEPRWLLAWRMRASLPPPPAGAGVSMENIYNSPVDNSSGAVYRHVFR
jgi:hypothetical protein